MTNVTTPTPDWKQSPTPGIRRATIVHPGFDCGRAGEKCQHPIKGDHGQHCPEWWYAVSNGRYAVTFVVWSNDFPRGRLFDGPKPRAIGFHAPTTASVEDIREGRTGEACQYIEAGRCFTEGQYNYAHAVWQRHGSASVEQTEAFWLDLENELVERARKHEAALAEAPIRCPTCHGEGVLKTVKS